MGAVSSLLGVPIFIHDILAFIAVLVLIYVVAKIKIDANLFSKEITKENIERQILEKLQQENAKYIRKVETQLYESLKKNLQKSFNKDFAHIVVTVKRLINKDDEEKN
ncbi:hypothetical protein [Winogradskyella sp.]|uniref:hypothetical protein n=1 Tax=Winogradskyella sp. TaxID=1883156 RepID=UPI0026221C10|nr:hypothetical protein [Winogradskyella sp.]